MFKRTGVCLVALTIGLLLSPTVKAVNRVLPYDYSYQGVVKIYTYYQDGSYNLTEAKSGSGVLINQDGLVLTNEHVVTVNDAMDSDLPVAFKVCLTDNPAKEPDCSYNADLVAKDKKQDIALLKIRSGGLKWQDGFGYLALATDNSFHEKDSVVSIGYPSSGGDTVTWSKGSISGTIEKFGISWIKTDALVSFGSSGGALIDINGRVLGITSALNSDIGYVINLSSVSQWIGENSGKAPTNSALFDKMSEMIVKQKSLKTIDKFVNNLPRVELIKPENWKFKFTTENSITAYNNENSEGGSVSVRWDAIELLIDDKAMDVLMKFFEIQNTCFSAGVMTIAGKTGRKITCPVGGEDVQQVFIAVKNYFALVTYYYGKNNVDKYQVDTMLNRLVISDQGVNFSEKRSYEQQNPYFKITLPADWSLKSRNSVSEPLVASSKVNPEVSFIVYIGKLTEGQKDITNESYFNYIRDADVVKNEIESSTGLKGTRYFNSSAYRLNDELTKEIFYKYKFKDEDDEDAIKYYAAGYRIRTDNKVIIIRFDWLGESEQVFEQQLKSFQDNVLINLTLGRTVEKKNDITTKVAPKTETKTEQTVKESVIQSAAGQIQSIKNLGKKFIGRILLRVQNSGEAWYLSPKTNQAHYLANGQAAYQLMREQGLGITNKDLAKIPLGLSNMSGDDSDQDGLTDALELALGTDKDKADSDNDGFNDKSEIQGDFNPLQASSVKMPYNLFFANRQKGKILLQVESRGQAWYVNPKDGKRYFLGTAEDAYQVMREQSLGIAENDFAKL